jgi:hypothetical protein
MTSRGSSRSAASASERYGSYPGSYGSYGSESGAESIFEEAFQRELCQPLPAPNVSRALQYMQAARLGEAVSHGQAEYPPHGGSGLEQPRTRMQAAAEPEAWDGAREASAHARGRGVGAEGAERSRSPALAEMLDAMREAQQGDAEKAMRAEGAEASASSLALSLTPRPRILGPYPSKPSAAAVEVAQGREAHKEKRGDRDNPGFDSNPPMHVQDESRRSDAALMYDGGGEQGQGGRSGAGKGQVTPRVLRCRSTVGTPTPGKAYDASAASPLPSASTFAAGRQGAQVEVVAQLVRAIAQHGLACLLPPLPLSCIPSSLC